MTPPVALWCPGAGDVLCYQGFRSRIRPDSLRQYIGLTHMRVMDGVDSFVQLTGLVAQLCQLGYDDKAGQGKKK